jgi:aldose 1-epimerase
VLVELFAGNARASVRTADGGVLSSLTVDGDELLVSQPERVRGVPHYGSFVLAPWVGEVFHGRMRYRGEDHQLPLRGKRHAVHGVVYDGPWEVLSASQDSLELSRPFGDHWPLGGSVRQIFELDPYGLTQRVEVSAGDAAMPVAIGWHPWFAVPATGETRLTADASSYAELDDDLIPTGRVLPLDGVADFGASSGGFLVRSATIDMVLVDVPSPACLRLPNRTVEVSFDPAISTLVVYATNDSICVEPWTSWPDAVRGQALGMPTGVIDLEPRQSVERWMRWSWGAGDAEEWAGTTAV